MFYQYPNMTPTNQQSNSEDWKKEFMLFLFQRKDTIGPIVAGEIIEEVMKILSRERQKGQDRLDYFVGRLNAEIDKAIKKTGKINNWALDQDEYNEIVAKVYKEVKNLGDRKDKK